MARGDNLGGVNELIQQMEQRIRRLEQRVTGLDTEVKNVRDERALERRARFYDESLEQNGGD